jgi:hypothetical protein
LFVIDSSPSMQDEQANLLQSFPGFIAAIEQTLMIDDFHIMVVDAGAAFGSGCGGELGAGTTQSASGEDCNLVGGNRYVTQEQPDLVEAFSCMASRGDQGPANERTMDSLLEAIGPMSEDGGCNAGFVREDAVLVVTIITDEEDDPGDSSGVFNPTGACEGVDDDLNSDGDPEDWKDTIIALKAGNPESVVMLGLLGDCDVGGDCPGIDATPTGFTGAEPAPRLRNLVGSLPYGTVGPVCAPDYAPFFEQAVSVIFEACEGFVQPG